jgi:hypothetical protein
MSERENEFEELLDRTLRWRVNAAPPVAMVERIAEAVGREMVVVRRRLPMWQMAVAASVVLAVAGSFYGWRYGRETEHGVAPQIAMRETPAEGVRAMSPAVSIAAPPMPHGVRTRATRRRPTSSSWAAGVSAVETNQGPKLDTFPSTAMNPPKPEPGSMEAQLQVLISLPQSTLAQMAEAQSKEQSASKVQADTQDKLN